MTIFDRVENLNNLVNFLRRRAGCWYRNLCCSGRPTMTARQDETVPRSASHRYHIQEYGVAPLGSGDGIHGHRPDRGTKGVIPLLPDKCMWGVLVNAGRWWSGHVHPANHVLLLLLER